MLRMSTCGILELKSAIHFNTYTKYLCGVEGKIRLQHILRKVIFSFYDTTKLNLKLTENVIISIFAMISVI